MKPRTLTLKQTTILATCLKYGKQARHLLCPVNGRWADQSGEGLVKRGLLRHRSDCGVSGKARGYEITSDGLVALALVNDNPSAPGHVWFRRFNSNQS